MLRLHIVHIATYLCFMRLALIDFKLSKDPDFYWTDRRTDGLTGGLMDGRTDGLRDGGLTFIPHRCEHR